MLIGAHVSPAGGPAKAIARGVERGAHAIQIFNQNPRAWKPRAYAEDEVAAFKAAIAASHVSALLIHAVYLLNCASAVPEIREKTLASLTGSLRAGDALGAHAVVLHAGSALAGEVAPAIARAGEVIAEALAESDVCPLHLENTAGTGGTLGRSFAELAALIEVAGGDERLGVCLDSCHLLASGYEIRTPEGAGRRAVGVRRAGRARAARLAAPQRLGDAAGVEPRPPCERRRGRDRDGWLRGVPVRAALRGTAVRARDARAQALRPARGRDRAGASAARARAWAARGGALSRSSARQRPP